MNLDKKFIAKMTRIYGLIVVISNIIAMLVPSVISLPVLDTDNMQKWQAFLNQNKMVSWATFTAFITPTLVCVLYTIKIFKSDEQIAKNIAGIPSVFALSSVLGWNVYYFIEIPFVIYARALFGIHIKGILLTSWFFALFSGMTGYTISYLMIEILNRTILLPRVFPEGHIIKQDFKFKPLFKHLLIFGYMVSTLFPVTLLLISYISVHINNHLELNPTLIYISVMLVIIAYAISLSFAKIILTPLDKLKKAAHRIKEGDYKTRVGVVTADDFGILADSFNDMADSLAEKEFMRDTFGKIVDPEVRDYLMSGEGKQSLGQTLGGQTREVTVLFCDIRNFTGMSEKMKAAEVVSLLNRYFTALGKCITVHHGIINKYIGDAIMAIFGAPVESKNSAQDAFEAACDMRKALVQVNQEFAKTGLPQLKFGIGIHTGPVFAGTIGAENRMEYTVIGDTVNTASRLESLCKTYSTDLLISQASQEKLNKNLTFVDDAQIRGKTELMKIYTLPNP
ncbi:MAG: HAMP domain-containing protein [Treponema sp.]|nr:HAMP domain-containing protein [Treponema sp.]